MCGYITVLTMFRWAFVLLLVVVVVVVAEEDSDVLELDTDNFKEEIADKEIILIEFYAPWCGHCKRLAPEYEIAATALLDNDPPIPLAKVDCPANTALCGQFGVSGYPTLKIFRGGEFSADYQGPRQADGIITHMKKQAGPSVRELSDLQALNKFLDNAEYGVVGFFSDGDSKLRSKFMSAANSMRDDFRFGYSSDPEVMEEYGYNDNVVLITPTAMQTKMEESRIEFDGEGSLWSFITENFMGLAGVRSENTARFFENKKPLAVAYFSMDYAHNPKGSNYWRNRVIKVAKEFMGEVNFAVSNKEDYASEIGALGLDSSTDEVIVGLYDSEGKYAMSEEFSVGAFRNFVQEYLDGKIDVYVKSEPLPEDDGALKVVVGKNFDTIVNDETKDVLVEFYAPWCGHCKSLAPKYEELAEKLSGDSNIVIAKTDATANDYPPLYDVKGFPTLYWVPAGSKDSPQKYEGGREISDFVSFIKKNATNKPVVVSGDEEEKKKKKKKKGKKEEL